MMGIKRREKGSQTNNNNPRVTLLVVVVPTLHASRQFPNCNTNISKTPLSLCLSLSALFLLLVSCLGLVPRVTKKRRYMNRVTSQHEKAFEPAKGGQPVNSGRLPTQ